MRKQTIPGLLLALFAIVTWTGAAMAGSGDPSAKDADAACSAFCKTADAGYGGACKAACISNKAASMVSTDAVINSYIDVQKGLLKGCAESTSTAVQAWHQRVEALMNDEKNSADSEPLAKLDAVLTAWPSEIAAQRQIFASLSEWMIDYCESHPDRAAGTSIASCPDSDHRWVQIEGVEGNPYTG